MDINREINSNLDINRLGINSHFMGVKLHISNLIMDKEINKDIINHKLMWNNN